MNKNNMRIILVTLFLLNAASVYADVLYSKPEFRGRIINAETKQPIEGAVVVALYYKLPMFSGPGGPNSYVFHAKETLTDNKGEFYLPSFSSLTFSRMDSGIRFIFYKPGYISIEGAGPQNAGISDAGISFEKYFSTDAIGKVAEIEEGTFEQGSYVKWRGPVGIVELKKGERDPSTPTNYRSTELPLLFKALNEDRKNRGYQGELK